MLIERALLEETGNPEQDYLKSWLQLVLDNSKDDLSANR